MPVKLRAGIVQTFHKAVAPGHPLLLLNQCVHLARHVSSSAVADKLFALLENMPKVAANPNTLRHIKQRDSGSLAPLSLAYFSVVGIGRDSPPAVMLNTNHFRYLFNCGESTQRLLQEHRQRMSRLEHVFITRLDWSALGGIPGMTLTLQDVGVPKLVMHGPAGLHTLYPALSSFLHTGNIEIAHEEDSHQFSDSLVEIRAIHILPNAVKGSSDVDAPYYNSVMAYIGRLATRQGRLIISKCIDHGVPPGPLLGRLKSGQTITLNNGHVVRPDDVKEPDEPGQMFAVVDCPNASFLDGYRCNRDFMSLQNPTRLEDGAKIVIHFTPLNIVKTDAYAEWMRSFPPATYHWVLPDDDSEEKSTSGTTAEDYDDALPAHYNPYRMQAKLALLDADTFPFLPRQRNPDAPSRALAAFNARQKAVMESTGSLSLRLMRPQQRFYLRASTNEQRDTIGFDGFSDVDCMQIDNAAFAREAFQDNIEFEGILRETHAAIQAQVSNSKQEEKSPAIPGAVVFPVVTFLGTGSCVPNKARNTSAILVDIDADASILLDCAEGTYGQLYRHFGHARIRDRLCRLRAVYISHKHADHHLGLIEVILHRKRMRLLSEKNLSGSGGQNDFSKPLLLFGPNNIFPMLIHYNAMYERIDEDYIFIGNHVLVDPSAPIPDFLQNISIDIYDGSVGGRRQQFWKPPENKFPMQLPSADAVAARIRDTLRLDRIEACYVRHSVLQSYAVKLHANNGAWSLVYSGDTMPCETLVQLARNCSVLIHEATMENDLAEEAARKMHSTTGDALDVAHRAQAEFLILTHFSQRYGKLPVFTNDSVFDLNRVAVAFDNMRIEPLNRRKCEKLALFPRALQAMFADDYEDMQDRNAKRQVARDRMAREEGGTDNADKLEENGKDKSYNWQQPPTNINCNASRKQPPSSSRSGSTSSSVVELEQITLTDNSSGNVAPLPASSKKRARIGATNIE